MEMNNNRLTVMANTAELAENIDVLRARQAKERAEQRIAGQKADVDFARAKLALRKALLRLEVANNE